ncbi:MAG: bifunctional riboflavin kinase/FAD synthetase [Bauldia sp.]|nr:bifunctional riboflavin kinase/FAD synthetase [Bauldia sp.]
MPSLPEIVRLGAGDSSAIPSGFRGGVVAIGNFDGVHRGHQALLRTAIDEAARHGTHPVVLTFEPHPRAVLRPETAMPRLTAERARLRVLGAFGIGNVVVVDFDRAFAAIEADEFAVRILGDRLEARAVIVGEGFRFGRGRGGDVDLLRRSGRFDVIAIPPVADAGGATFSSGRVRDALAAGDIAAANVLLGYRWFVEGVVVDGDKRGRELGFPTANLALDAPIGLKLGIYAVTLTRAGGQPLAAVASYGVRPMFESAAPLLEVHVFDFAGSLYGERVAVTFFDPIRGEERFASVEALVARMHVDSAIAREMLAGAGPGTPLDAALAAIA